MSKTEDKRLSRMAEDSQYRTEWHAIERTYQDLQRLALHGLHSAGRVELEPPETRQWHRQLHSKEGL